MKKKADTIPTKVSGWIYGHEMKGVPIGTGFYAPQNIVDYTLAGFEFYCDSYYGGCPSDNHDGKKEIPGWKWVKSGLWVSTDDAEAAQELCKRVHKNEDRFKYAYWFTDRAAKRLAELGANVALRKSRETIFTRTTTYERTLSPSRRDGWPVEDKTVQIEDKHAVEERFSGIWTPEGGHY